jgi:hypothetical protein
LHPAPAPAAAPAPAPAPAPAGLDASVLLTYEKEDEDEEEDNLLVDTGLPASPKINAVLRAFVDVLPIPPFSPRFSFSPLLSSPPSPPRLSLLSQPFSLLPRNWHTGEPILSVPPSSDQEAKQEILEFHIQQNQMSGELRYSHTKQIEFEAQVAASLSFSNFQVLTDLMCWFRIRSENENGQTLSDRTLSDRTLSDRHLSDRDPNGSSISVKNSLLITIDHFLSQFIYFIYLIHSLVCFLSLVCFFFPGKTPC